MTQLEFPFEEDGQLSNTHAQRLRDALNEAQERFEALRLEIITQHDESMSSDARVSMRMGLWCLNNLISTLSSMLSLYSFGGH